jgi:hypothetical protein
VRGVAYAGLAALVGAELSSRVTDQTLTRNLTILQCGAPLRRPALDDATPLRARDWPDCTPTVDVHRMNYTLIITDKCEGRTLQAVLADRSVPTWRQREILYKLILAIHDMHALGVCHNDLHWENVLVQEVPPTYEPMLFDWDRAVMRDGPPNTDLLDFADFYQTPYYEARDWVSLLSSLLLFYEQGQRSDALLACFLAPETPAEVRERWWYLVAQRHPYSVYISDTTLEWFGPRIEIDRPRLLAYFAARRVWTLSQIRAEYRVEATRMDVVYLNDCLVRMDLSSLTTWSRQEVLEALQTHPAHMNVRTPITRLRHLESFWKLLCAMNGS